jgi:hypothetical protein
MKKTKVDANKLAKAVSTESEGAQIKKWCKLVRSVKQKVVKQMGVKQRALNKRT